MIGKLIGVLETKTPPRALVVCAGVGYEVDVPMSTFYNLPNVGQSVALLTHLVVREEAQLLYGFGSEPERAAFRQLIKISGVGPRTALAILSGLSVADMAQAVRTQDVSRLVKVPGVGKKTAERLLLELRDKAPEALWGKSATVEDPQDERVDIAQALTALGYSDREAQLALKGLPAGVGISEGIRLALRGLTK